MDEVAPDDGAVEDGDGFVDVVALAVATAVGDVTTPAASPLHELQGDADTAALAAALRRLLTGADDPFLDGDLPPEQAAFLAAVRRRMADPTPDEPETP